MVETTLRVIGALLCLAAVVGVLYWIAAAIVSRASPQTEARHTTRRKLAPEPEDWRALNQCRYPAPGEPGEDDPDRDDVTRPIQSWTEST